MSIINDIVGQVVDGVLKEILKKTTGTRKRATRRKGTAKTQPRTASGRFKKRPAAPAKRQTSRRKTVRSRAKTRRA